MAHPYRKEADAGQNAKMKRMTGGYGSASGPANNILAESNRNKAEGPEESVGFDADASAPKARGDRASRRTTAANPVSTYNKGGKVTKRAWGGPTMAPAAGFPGPASGQPVPMPVPQQSGQPVPMPPASGQPVPMAPPQNPAGAFGGPGGGPSWMGGMNRDALRLGMMGRARGGRAKHGKKGGTHVNIMVGGGHPDAPPPPPVGMPPPVPPPMDAGPPPGGPPPGGGGPLMPPPPGMPPPGMMAPHAKGGKVHRASGGKIKVPYMTGGADSGVGRLQKNKHEAARD